MSALFSQAPPSDDPPTLFHLTCYILALVLLHFSFASISKAVGPLLQLVADGSILRLCFHVKYVQSNW